jgi:hypothetical protein
VLTRPWAAGASTCALSTIRLEPAPDPWRIGGTGQVVQYPLRADTRSTLWDDLSIGVCVILSDHVSKASEYELEAILRRASEPLAYRAGGYGLAFLTLGSILMLTAFFWMTGPDQIHRIGGRRNSDVLYSGLRIF